MDVLIMNVNEPPRCCATTRRRQPLDQDSSGRHKKQSQRHRLTRSARYGGKVQVQEVLSGSSFISATIRACTSDSLGNRRGY